MPLNNNNVDNSTMLNMIQQLNNWGRNWGMRFQPVKCNMMQLTRKHLNKIQASYTLEGAALENVNNIKNLDVTITNQRTNGPVNAHLISWPNRAQNIQNLETTWSRNDLDLQYLHTYIISISCLHLPTSRSQAAIVSEKSTVFTFLIEKPK